MELVFTKEQITLIKRTSNNIILCLDGDSAGKKAMYSVEKNLNRKILIYIPHH